MCTPKFEVFINIIALYFYVQSIFLMLLVIVVYVFFFILYDFILYFYVTFKSCRIDTFPKILMSLHRIVYGIHLIAAINND